MEKKEYMVPTAQIFMVDLKHQITNASSKNVTSAGLDDDPDDGKDDDLHYNNRGASQWLAW